MHEVENQLSNLASEIRREMEAAEDKWREAVAHAIRAGELLTEAKATVRHGQWLPWLRENFPGAERTAQLYMRLARESATVADLPSVRAAVAALTTPREAEAESEPERKGPPDDWDRTPEEWDEIVAEGAALAIKGHEMFDRFRAMQREVAAAIHNEQNEPVPPEFQEFALRLLACPVTYEGIDDFSDWLEENFS